MKEDILKELSATYEPRSYTYGDYLKFTYDELVEIIRGKIFKMTPAPLVIHQLISGNLFNAFSNHLKDNNCLVFHAPIDVVLPIKNKKRNTSDTVVQPDLCVVCDLSIIEETAIFGPPDIIIEILSPHSKKKDLQLKFDVYEESGVKEYWIVMPLEKLIEVFSLQVEKYVRINTYTEEDVISSPLLKGLNLKLSTIFKDVLKN